VGLLLLRWRNFLHNLFFPAEAGHLVAAAGHLRERGHVRRDAEATLCGLGTEAEASHNFIKY
jgi:hypothetical protein